MKRVLVKIGFLFLLLIAIATHSFYVLRSGFSIVANILNIFGMDQQLKQFARLLTIPGEQPAKIYSIAAIILSSASIILVVIFLKTMIMAIRLHEKRYWKRVGLWFLVSLAFYFLIPFILDLLSYLFNAGIYKNFCQQFSAETCPSICDASWGLGPFAPPPGCITRTYIQFLVPIPILF